MRALMLTAAALFALNGCSIINAPDTKLLDAGGGGDSGMDGGMDGDAGDGGLDGDADASDGCKELPEVCDDGEDNNCNGLVDCNDFGCAQLERCCDRPMPETIPYTDLTGTWEVIPQGGGGIPLLDASNNITDFMGGGSPTGYLLRYCLPLEAGYEISTTFRDLGARCDMPDSACFARIALTPSPGSAIGSRISEDIGVEMTSTGSIVVTQAGTPIPLLSDITVPIGEWVKVTLTLTAGQYPGGEAAVVATVRAATLATGGTPRVLLENRPIAPRDRLLTGPGGLCDESRGLRLAVEGEGSQIHVDPIETVALQCLNVGRFGTPENGDGPLSSTGVGEPMPEGSLEWVAWGSGGVGAPSLVGLPATSPTSWHVFGDATDLDRGEEGATPMSFRIGHSSSGAMLWDDVWSTTERGSGPAPVPRFGPPCTSTPCWSDDYSIREPSVIDVGSPSEFMMAAAVRLAGDSDSYGLYVGSINVADSGRQDPNVSIEPSEVLPEGACDSLRHPALVAASPEPATDGYWLFFTCEKEMTTGPPRWDIRVIKFPAAGGGETFMSHVVVAPEAETFRASAVYAPEVIVDRIVNMMGIETGPPTYRLWYLARDRNQEVSIGFAQGQENDQALDGGIPANFVQYSANPILRDGSAFFDGCPDCVTTGLAVTRTSSTTLRFLFARSDDEGNAWDRRFVPAEQYWSAEATPMMTP